MEYKAFKIVEEDSLGRHKTLFHGLNGTRVIKRGEWLEADEKLVTDGTSKTRYLSGWHVLLEEQDAKDYLKSFTKRLDKLKIVPVTVKNIRSKEHSRSPVFLAKYLKYEV
jgi:hypothetical protein